METTDKAPIAENKRLVRRCDNLSRQIERLESVKNSLENERAVMAANLINAQVAVDNIKVIMRTALEDHNNEKSELNRLLSRYKSKLKELGFNGDIG